VPRTVTAVPQDRKWISVRQGRLATHKTRDELQRLAAAGAIRVQALPCIALKLCAENVARIAAEAK
jgi:hypothetical protein